MAEEVIKKEAKFANLKKGLIRFAKDVKNELKKVIWPTRTQLINNTLTVLGVCFIIGAVIWVADFGLVRLADLVFKTAK